LSSSAEPARDAYDCRSTGEPVPDRREAPGDAQGGRAYGLRSTCREQRVRLRQSSGASREGSTCREQRVRLREAGGAAGRACACCTEPGRPLELRRTAPESRTCCTEPGCPLELRRASPESRTSTRQHNLETELGYTCGLACAYGIEWKRKG
jgi:hypothetical protein